MKVFVCDIAKCNGCGSCQIVCKDEHCGADWAPIARPQPETGHFWMRLSEKVRGSIPYVRISYIPIFCAHCADAPCMAAAKDGAVYRRDDGLVIIDPEKSQGQHELMEACPLGAIYWNEELNIPQKCTGCAHLLDDGWDVPRCVDACATGALLYGEEEDFAELLSHSEEMDLVKGKTPRVHYLNLPKRFVAGCLVDFEEDEVVVGAHVSLARMNDDVVSGESERPFLRYASDEMGDFLFDQIESGIYRFEARKPGYRNLSMELDVREADLCLGDVGLTRS